MMEVDAGVCNHDGTANGMKWVGFGLTAAGCRYGVDVWGFWRRTRVRGHVLHSGFGVAYLLESASQDMRHGVTRNGGGGESG